MTGEAAPQVRLTAEEIAAIRRIIAAHFGPAAEVRVFGSRTRPDVLGGDLDLIVRLPGAPPPAQACGAAAFDIEDALDELPVDLVVLGEAGPSTAFERYALAESVPL
jgi:predicted nucleotidyltransferase